MSRFLLFYYDYFVSTYALKCVVKIIEVNDMVYLLASENGFLNYFTIFKKLLLFTQLPTVGWKTGPLPQPASFYTGHVAEQITCVGTVCIVV